MAKQNSIVKFAGLSTAAAVLAVLCATGVIKVESPRAQESESPVVQEQLQTEDGRVGTSLPAGDSQSKSNLPVTSEGGRAAESQPAADIPAASKPAAVTFRTPAAPAAVAKQETVREQKARAEETRPIPAGTYHGTGTVIKLLADDLEPPCHQRFLLKLPDGDTLLVTHNIDLAPRINALHTGDKVEFCGEFFDNDKGGGVHWTHKDPRGRHKAGWLKHNGKIYE